MRLELCVFEAESSPARRFEAVEIDQVDRLGSSEDVCERHSKKHATASNKCDLSAE